MNTTNKNKTSVEKPSEVLSENEKALKEKELSLKEWEQNLENKEQQLIQRETALELREKDLNKKNTIPEKKHSAEVFSFGGEDYKFTDDAPKSIRIDGQILTQKQIIESEELLLQLVAGESSLIEKIKK